MREDINGKIIYGDEENLKALVAARYAQRHSILNEVSVGGAKYIFEPYEVILSAPSEICFSIMLPANVKPMPQAAIDIKYLANNKSEIVLMVEGSPLVFSFDCFTADDDLETRLAECKQAIKNQYPHYAFFSEETHELENGIRVALLDFCGNALDDDVYYQYIYIKLPECPNEEVMGVFSCPLDFRDEWEPLFLQMIESITHCTN